MSEQVLQEMPAHVERRNHELNLCARACYGMRNAEREAGRLNRADAYHEFGDVYLSRALALTAEWNADA